MYFHEIAFGDNSTFSVQKDASPPNIPSMEDHQIHDTHSNGEKLKNVLRYIINPQPNGVLYQLCKAEKNKWRIFIEAYEVITKEVVYSV